MRFTLRVRMHNTEGVLERVLGRLRQRNFSICSLMADSSVCNSFMTARITVESERPMESALKQIGKLYDVTDVHLAENESNNGYQHFEPAVAPSLEVCVSV